MTPVTTAIIGCGPRSYGHAKAAREGGALQVRYACDILPDRLAKAVAEWGVKGVEDYRVILADPAVEAVNIVTDVGNHLPIVRDALRAGKHVLCEKPFGDDIAAARALADEAARSRLVTCISFQLRFADAYASLKSAAASIDPVQAFLGRSRGMMKPQFLNPSPFCGIMDFMAHDFDLAAWLMGRAPEAVTAVLRRDTFTRSTGAADTLSVLVDFGDGRSATLVSSIGAAEIGEKCDITGAAGNVRMERGGARYGVRFQPTQSDGPKEPIELTGAAGLNPDIALQRAFAAEVRGGAPSRLARFSDGLHSLLVTMACLESAVSRRRVCLSEVR